MSKEKVIIIGAGPAGLTMAHELLKDEGNLKYDVTILEDSNDIGGISKTVLYNGNRMDIGGHRFFSKDERVMNFWKELMPIQGKDSIDDKILNKEKQLEKGGPDPEIEDDVMLIRQRISRIYYLKKFFDYPISMKMQTIKNMGFGRTIKAGLSYLHACIFKREEKSLEDFYINRFGKILYSMFFEKYTEKLWGRHPSEISADWGAQRVKGISIKAVIKDMLHKAFGKKDSKNTETSLIEQFWYPKFGPGHLWETLAGKIETNGGKILKRHTVKKVNFENGKIVSVTCDVEGKTKEIAGDIFVSSMPMNDLVAAFSGIEVPERIKKIGEGLPFRDFQAVGLLVDKLNLKNETNIKTLGNIVPDCWIYVQEPEVKMLRIQIFNNWSPYLVKDVQNKVWIGLEYTCSEGDKYWNMTDKEFIDFATSELVSMNIITKGQVEDAHREKIKKAYPAYFDTYKDIDKLVDFVNDIENIYCIGRNGQHRYNNMDHSMVTAMEAANNIKNGIQNKTNIWNVNTDKEYHEIKERRKRAEMNTYLITGGAGFFGSILKKSLIDDGSFVVSIDLEKDDFVDKHFVAIQGDIRDTELLDEIFKKYKFDAIFHCAALLAHEVKDKKVLWTSNVDGTRNMLEYAEKNNCKKILFISSNCLWGHNFDKKVTEEEEPNPVEIYGKSKLEGEKILIAHKDKVNSVIFRSPTIIDEGRLGLLSLLFEFIDDNKKIPIVGNGKNMYQFIYAKDMVQAMKSALNYDRTDIFNIGSNNVKTFNEVYEYVIQKAGSKSKLFHFPKWIMIACMKIAFLLHISPLGPYQYKMISSSFVFDTSKIKDKLNFVPTLTNEEMLYKSYMYYHNNRKEIENRKDVSAHRKNAKMGVIRILKWMM